jgi:acyl-CoA thioester hydrolase
MSTPFAITRRVEFGDTDMAGIMHFSNFFRFMEVAETDFLLARGLTVSWFEDGRKLGFPRVSASCDYAKPAKFGDLLTVAVTVEKVGRKSVAYRFDFTRGPDPIAVGRMTAVYCRSDQQGGIEALDIPPAVRGKLEG